MNGQGKPADAKADANVGSSDVAEHETSNNEIVGDPDIFGLTIGSRLWIASLTTVCICVFAAVVSFHFEQRSSRLSDKIQLLVQLQTAKNELIAASIFLVGSSAEEREDNLLRVQEATGKLGAARQFLERENDQNRFPGLGDDLADITGADIPELARLVLNVRVAMQEGGAVNSALVKLVEFGMGDFRNKTADLITKLNRQKHDFKNLRILTLSGAVGILIVAVLVIMIYVFRPLQRRLATLSQEMRVRKKEFEAAQENGMSSRIARSEFLGRISHEIRTPLNGMLATSEMLCTAGLTEQQRTLASALMSTTKNLTSSFENVINYSELASGNNAPDLEIMSVQDLAGELVVLCGELNTNSCVQSFVDMDETLPDYVVCDKERVLQLLRVLVDNAFKYTTEGYVRIRIWQQPSSHDSQMPNLVFCVQDTGIGIASEKQEIIFQEFTQVDNSLTRAHDGLGLGLALALRIADLLGGKLRLNSRLGNGARFYFELPCRVVEGVHEPKVALWEKFQQRLNLMIIAGGDRDKSEIRDRLSEQRFDISFVESAAAAVGLAKAANNGGIGIDAVILGREFLNTTNPAFALATLRNTVPTETAFIGLGSWYNWSSAGVFRTADIDTVERDILSCVAEKDERMHVLNTAA